MAFPSGLPFGARVWVSAAWTSLTHAMGPIGSPASTRLTGNGSLAA